MQDVVLGEPWNAQKNDKFMALQREMDRLAKETDDAYEQGMRDNDMSEYNRLKDKFDALMLQRNEIELTEKAHFSQYTLPGVIEGSYREQFVTAREIPSGFDASKVEIKRHLISVTQGTTSIWYDGKKIVEYSDDPQLKPGGEYKQRPDSHWLDVAKDLYERGDRINKIPSKSNNWQDGQSAYSDIKNPIVRIRFNDRLDADGNTVRFIEELQGPSLENEKKMPEIYRKYRYQIGLKRILQGIAQENIQREAEGKPLITRLAWTPCDVQADRYDLSKHLAEVTVSISEDGYRIAFVTKQGDRHTVQKVIGESELEEHVGKDLAKQVLGDKTWAARSGGWTAKNGHKTRAEAKEAFKKIDEAYFSKSGYYHMAPVFVPSFSGNASKTYSGLDLMVGGEGLKRLYNETIPKFLEKYGEQWGVKVKETKIKGKYPENYLPQYLRGGDWAIIENGVVVQRHRRHPVYPSVSRPPGLRNHPIHPSDGFCIAQLD